MPRIRNAAVTFHKHPFPAFYPNRYALIEPLFLEGVKMAGKRKKKDTFQEKMSTEIAEKLKEGADPTPNRISGITEEDVSLIAKLETVHTDLGEISGDVSDHLISIMKSNEELTRETYLAQVEIKRASELKDTLAKNLATFKAELDEITDKNRNLDKDVKKLRKKLDDLEIRKTELLEEKARLEAAVTKLSSESEGLSGENDKLAVKKDNLAGEVSSLKKIREEYLSQISKFKDMKEDLLD